MSADKGSLNRDHYMVLGISPMSTRDDIKKAYRERAKLYHPDLNPNALAHGSEKMKELTAAYEVVTDAQQRKDYDAQPQFHLRIPAGLRRASSSADSRAVRSSLWARLLGMFSSSSNHRGGDRQVYQTHFSTAVTCAQFPGGKLLTQAEGDFSRALEARPDSQEALYNLGLVCYWQGKFPEARRFFQALTARSPQDAQAQRMADLLSEA